MALSNEVRDLTNAEILQRINEAKAELFNLRFQKAGAPLKNPQRLREVRRDIARYKTILRERQLASEIIRREEKK
jgi:large subunit ribosomal protein L29